MDGSLVARRPAELALRTPQDFGHVGHHHGGAVGSNQLYFDSSQQQRRKKWAPKVRTGCKTCRGRRIKCDEAKPACQQCVLSRFKCEGFGYRDGIPESRVKRIPQPCVSLAPFATKATWQELQFFDLFRTETVKQVTGGVNQTFWATDILQAALAYPALWHASLAIAAMHKQSQQRRSPAICETLHESDMFALRHYNLSIKHIIDATKGQKQDSQNIPPYATQEMLLMASVLYFALASLRGDENEAILHARNGLQLFGDWNFSQHQAKNSVVSKRRGVLAVDSLSSLMEFIEFQFIMRLSSVPRPPRRQRHAVPFPDTPFTSATEAYARLIPFLNALLDSWNDVRLADTQLPQHPETDARHSYRLHFDVWKGKFQDFQTSEHRRPEESVAIRKLELYAAAVQMQLYVDLSEPEMSWDQYKSEFERMADISEQLFKEEAEEAVKGQPKQAFSFSLSICEPLGFIATACRNGKIRRKVLSLLRKWPLREGIWDTNLTASVCEAIMHLEEQGGSMASPGDGCLCRANEFICRLHRVRRDQVEFEQDGRVKLMILTVEDVEQQRPWRISWLR